MSQKGSSLRLQLCQCKKPKNKAKITQNDDEIKRIFNTAFLMVCHCPFIQGKQTSCVIYYIVLYYIELYRIVL